MSETSNVNSNEAVTEPMHIEDSNGQNHRSENTKLLQQVGKLWLMVGYIPLEFPQDTSQRCKSDVDDKTNITVVFTDYSDPENMNIAIETYEKMFDSKTIIIQMKDAWFNKCALTGMNNELAILCVQPSEKLQMRTSFCSLEEYEKQNNVAERICYELIPEKNDSKIILLLFGAADEGDHLAQKVLQLAKTKLKPKTYNVWGSKCEEIIKELDADDQMHICFGLTISSSKIETWSYMNTDCFITYSELHKSLLTFRKSVKLRSKSLGLVIGPAELMNESKMLGFEVHDNSLNADHYMQIIKDVFPNIPLLGAFNYDCDNIYTSSPNSGACSDIFVCGKLISLLIISYD